MVRGLCLAVSVALYLPPLFPGGGRISSLTTEAVALPVKSNRRVAVVLANPQSVLPGLVYLAVLVPPALVYGNRRGLSGDDT